VRKRRLAAFVAAVLVFGIAPVRAVDTVPEGNKFVFSVERKGDEIGRHIVTYSAAENGGWDIDIRAEIKVKLAFITVYRMEHAGHEIWQDDTLRTMTTRTNNNGDKERVVLRIEDGQYILQTREGRRTAPMDLVPSSFTNPDFWIAEGKKKFLLLDTLDGDLRPSRLVYEGREKVTLDGQTHDTRYYRAYDLKRDKLSHEFWVDDAGYLLKTHLVTKDGESLYYRQTRVSS